MCKEPKYYENKLLPLLIFLFPVAGVSVRHWYSFIATLIIIYGIYLLIIELKDKSKRFSLYSTNEIRLLVLIPLLFVSYLASGFVNGWNEEQLGYFSREMNFLFFVPVYMAVRSVKSAPDLIIKGTVLSGAIIFAQYVYEIHVIDVARVNGIYGYIFTGSVAVMMGFIMISSYKYYTQEYLIKVSIIIFSCLSFAAAIYTKSGTASVLSIILLIIVPFIVCRELKVKVFVSIIFIIIALASYKYNDSVNHSVKRLLNSAETTIAIKNKVRSDAVLGTVGDRLVMWMAGWEIFVDNPIFGIGRGNYNSTVNEYYKMGRVNKEVTNHSHPHNMYIETIVSKGMLGFIILVFIIFQILKQYYSSYKKRVKYSEVALVHIFSILILGFGIAAPLIKNNFYAIFIIYTAAFYSSMNRKKV